MRRRDMMKTTIGAAALSTRPFRSLAQAAAPWTLRAQGEVTMIENDFVPLVEGVRLAVQLWLPANPKRRPLAGGAGIPSPYRKRDRYWSVRD